jgi:hypothetical protein
MTTGLDTAYPTVQVSAERLDRETRRALDAVQDQHAPASFTNHAGSGLL